jgi:L-asparagine transporter-like permease
MFVTVILLLIVFGALVLAEVLDGSGQVGPLTNKPQNGGQPTSQPSS